MKSIVELQALRGLAVLMVIIGHVHQAQERFMGPALIGDMAYIGFAGVDVFFVISGFIIHYLYRQAEKPDAGYFLKRLNRIYPLYWLYTLAALGGYALLGDALSRDAATFDWINTLTLLPTGAYPVLAVGWTLTHELYFYLVYGLVLFLPARLRLPVLGAWGLVTLIFVFLGQSGWPEWGKLLLSPFNLLFLAGIALAEGFKWAERFKWVGLALMVAGLGLAGWFTQIDGLQGFAQVSLRVGMFAPLAIGVVWALLAFKPKLPDIAIKLGDWSYSTYLSHLLVIGVMARLAAPILTALPMTGVLAYLVLISAALAYGAVSFYLIEKPLLKLGRGVIGKLTGR